MIPHNILPTGTHYFIAGGWAACPALAEDRDVFVQTRYDLAECRREIIRWLDDQKLSYVEEVAKPHGYEHLPGVRVARVIITRAQDIHIMVTNDEVIDVLNSFDISTTQVAITSDGRIVKSDTWTPTFQQPRIINKTPTTQERWYKYLNRFEFDSTGSR